jgi:adenylate kinase family enzyme
VVGCSGSGKTTAAAALAAALDCPAIELDSIFHQPGWTKLPEGEFHSRVDQATLGPAWVVDGNYSTVQDVVWGRADTVVWFDLSFSTVMARTVRRTLQRVLRRTELWNGNREPFSNLWSLNPHKSIIAWSATRHGHYRRRYLGAMHDPQWSDLSFIRLRTQGQVDQFLQTAASSMAPEEEN